MEREIELKVLIRTNGRYCDTQCQYLGVFEGLMEDRCECLLFPSAQEFIGDMDRCPRNANCINAEKVLDNE